MSIHPFKFSNCFKHMNLLDRGIALTSRVNGDSVKMARYGSLPLFNLFNSGFSFKRSLIAEFTWLAYLAWIKWSRGRASR